MVNPKWAQLLKFLMDFADENPYSVIEKIEIVDGLPQFMVVQPASKLKGITTKVKVKL